MKEYKILKDTKIRKYPFMDDFFYYKPGWKIGTDDNEDVPIGIYVNVFDCEDIGGANLTGFTFDINLCILHPDKAYNENDYLDENDLPADKDAPHLSIIYDAVSYGVGVPCEDFFINNISDASGAKGVDLFIKKTKPDKQMGIYTYGNEKKAFKAAEYLIKERSEAMMSLIGFFLDKGFNRIGTSRWELIRQQANKGYAMKW